MCKGILIMLLVVTYCTAGYVWDTTSRKWIYVTDGPQTIGQYDQQSQLSALRLQQERQAEMQAQWKAYQEAQQLRQQQTLRNLQGK